jgi:hypothetical protein
MTTTVQMAQGIRHRAVRTTPIGKNCHAGRRSIPPGRVARRLQTAGFRAPRALPRGRLTLEGATL